MTLQSWETELREGYGKAVGFLLSRGFDLMDSEDAVGAAVSAALSAWPSHPPANPTAWLLTVAYRNALDQKRKTQRNVSLAEVEDVPNSLASDLENHIPDERLRLFFLCTHPAIDASLQTPLMLQLVLGMTVESLSDLYLVPPPTLAQRLVRVKKKIKIANIEPRLPEATEMEPRVSPVLDAIYGLYFSEWRQEEGPHEALYLALILAELIPEHPETLGLAALISHCQARRSARISPGGSQVSLDDQDPQLWDEQLINDAEGLLRAASEFRRAGRYQLEAAIQSAHVGRLRAGRPGWAEIVGLYDRLIAFAPTAGFVLGRISALGRLRGPEAALAHLDSFASENPDLARSFQPYFASRAHWLMESGKSEEAHRYAMEAWKRAVTDAERKFLQARYGLENQSS